MRCLAIAALGMSCLSFGQQSSRPMPLEVATLLPSLERGSIDAVDALAKTKQMEAWRELCRSYESQPAEVQAAILRQLGDFGDSFSKAIEVLPEFGMDAEAEKKFKEELDELFKKIDGEATKAQLDSVREMVDKLSKRATVGVDPEGSKRIATDLVNLVMETVGKGLKSKDPRLVQEGQGALRKLADRYYSPFEEPFEMCGGSSKPYRWVMNDFVTTAMRQEVQRRPAASIAAVDDRLEGYGAAALALADMHVASAKRSILALIDDEDTEAASTGCACLVTWPFKEGLPYLVRRLDREEVFDSEAFRSAFWKYGAEGPLAISDSWDRLSSKGKIRALETESEVRCRASLQLIQKASKHEDAEVRLAVVRALDVLFCDPWDDAPETDLTEADTKLAHSLLVRLAADKDKAVSDEAREQLDRLEPPPIS